MIRILWFYSWVPNCGIGNRALDLFHIPRGDGGTAAPRAAGEPGIPTHSTGTSEKRFLYHAEAVTHTELSN